MVKELEDSEWFPSVLRNYQTEFIGFVVSRFNVYDVFVNYVKQAPLSATAMTDLCSGSGEPAISIYKKTNRFSSLSLSDKYPGALAKKLNKNIAAISRTDVLEMEFEQGKYYTMFNAFHHFRDEEKQTIVHKILLSGSPAFIVEVLEPTVLCFLKVLLTTTFGLVLLTPFVSPFSLKRLFFTYVIPVNIFIITYDGIVSVLKSYSMSKYKRVFAHNGKKIKIFRLQNGLSPLIVIQLGGET